MAAANAVNPATGGFLSTIAGNLLGTKAGIVAAGIMQLQATGLSLAQIEVAATTLLNAVKASAGPNLAKQIGNVFPGLAKAA